MAIYKRGYERYQGPLTSHWTRMLALPRFAWRRLFQQRLVLVLLIASLIWPLLCGLFVYLSNRLDLLQSLPGDFKNMLDINGNFFLVFMDVQAVFSVLLAALAGPGLIAPDLANNALPLYFSRPLTRVDYVVARMATLVGLLSLVTWLPGVLLFWMQAGMAGWTWFTKNWYLGVGVFCGFVVWVLVVSLVALACSAYVKWRIVAGGLVLGFFFLLTGAAQIVNLVLSVGWGSLLNPGRSMFIIWSAMLGVPPPPGPGLWPCVFMLAGMAAVLGLILERKLRAVEVIS
jgi:ABC-2 type transport system permease protein